MYSSQVNHPFFVNLTGAYEDEFSKTWITPTICIGGETSSYEDFQVVVNANYPPNRIAHDKIGRRQEKLGKTECTLYLVGLCDHDIEKETLPYFLDYLIPRLRNKYVENPNTKFLFHCFAGKSRSVTIALSFMVEVLGMTLNDALNLVQEKRPIINPRPLFIEILRQREQNSF